MAREHACAEWADSARGPFRRRTGLDCAGPVEAASKLGAVADLALDPVERGALARVVEAIELGNALDTATRAFVRRALAPLGAWVGDGPNPDVLHVLARRALVEVDALAVEDVAVWWNLGQRLVPQTPDGLRAQRAARVRASLAIDICGDDIRASADRIRATLQSSGTCPIPRHLSLLPDLALISTYVTGSVTCAADATALSRAWCGLVRTDATAACRLVQDARVLGIVADSPALHGPLAPAGLSRGAARASLLSPIEPLPDGETVREWLVERAAARGGALPIDESLRLAATEGVFGAIDALVSGPIDYGDFDAPGEGELPGWWAAVSMLAGEDARQAAERVCHADPDVDPVAELIGIESALRHAPGFDGLSLGESESHGLHADVHAAYGGELDDQTD